MIVALDYETSGLDSKRHAPVTLGVAIMEGMAVMDSREWLFAPPVDKNGKITREYDVCALEISATPWSKIKKEGLSVSTVCRELGAWLKGQDARSLLTVAFNAPFDYSFYSEMLFMGGSWNQLERRFETFEPPLIGPWQCVRMLAVHALPGLPKYDLNTVAAHFGLSRSDSKHGALEDAILAGTVYHLLQEQVRPTECAA